MSPAAVYLIVICGLGGLIACAAFVWAALKGELTDPSAALLVFDEEDEAGRERRR